MAKTHETMGHYAFFCNRECEYFPCHPTDDPAQFNCLFCFCPLYALGTQCGGNFTLLDGGVKDCSRCLYPHIPAHYAEIMERLADLRLPETASEDRK